MWKNLGFVLINFEGRCFSLLILFYLSKKHVFIKYISKNNTKVQSLISVISVIVYGAKYAVR